MSTQRTLGVGKYLLVGTGLLVFAYYILRLTILNADAATNGLVAAYNFDAGTGTTLTDISAKLCHSTEVMTTSIFQIAIAWTLQME